MAVIFAVLAALAWAIGTSSLISYGKTHRDVDAAMGLFGSILTLVFGILCGWYIP